MPVLPNARAPRPLRLALAPLLLLILLCPSISGCRTEPAQPVEPAREAYRPRIDLRPYESAIGTEDGAYLLLANRSHALGEGYVPAPLTVLDASLTLYGKEVEMEATAAAAAEALVLEMRALGYADIAVASGYRSYAYQRSLFGTYIEREMEARPGLTRGEAEALVQTYSARPGESEHQTGLCMDLISLNRVELDESFEENPAFAWLAENARHFGFILRYPKGRQEIVGYAYEPWHYRFVGRKAAEEIASRGLTLEEYLR